MFRMTLKTEYERFSGDDVFVGDEAVLQKLRQLVRDTEKASRTGQYPPWDAKEIRLEVEA